MPDREEMVRQAAIAASRASIAMFEAMGMPFAEAQSISFDALRVAVAAHILASRKDPVERRQACLDTTEYIEGEVARVTAMEKANG